MELQIDEGRARRKIGIDIKRFGREPATVGELGGGYTRVAKTAVRCLTT
jgi:hypothetical protein